MQYKALQYNDAIRASRRSHLRAALHMVGAHFLWWLVFRFVLGWMAILGWMASRAARRMARQTA